ncbi:phosphonate metabolism transcriptional regulator PhnF [Roseovarius sp. SYSU LYC5161]|uniref:phosphonate metabolism transcriptional regulator PhnF n=1 Tax=Roseovarius halophilus (ex Wu et al. 2025) TaxID=3376060 RepID=UPI003999E4C9
MGDESESGRGTPLWKTICDSLREDIAERRYDVGAKLPTEAQLAGRFGVNRHTVRHAIKHLVAEGIVRTRRGSGVFVTSQPTDYAIGKRVRFHENIRAVGQKPGREALQIETRTSAESEARALQIAPGAPVCVYRGLSLADAMPIALFVSVFPVQRLPEIESALRAQDSVTRALEQVGVHDYTRVSTRLTAVVADAAQALHLQLREGAPLLRSTSLNADTDGRPVEYGRTWFAGDRVTLTLED